MPLVEARSRLAMAKLLLQHTHNAGDARQHLERAVCTCQQDMQLNSTYFTSLHMLVGLSKGAALHSSCYWGERSGVLAYAVRLPANLPGARQSWGRSVCRNKPLQKPSSLARAQPVQQIGEHTPQVLAVHILSAGFQCMPK